MKQGGTLVFIGTTLGLASAWAGMRMLSGIFSSVASTSASNPVLIVGVPLLLASLVLYAGPQIYPHRSSGHLAAGIEPRGHLLPVVTAFPRNSP
jgi:hypothetical protein